MLSALSPSSISNAANNNHPSVDAPSIKPSSAMMDHASSNSSVNSNNSNSNNSNSSSDSPYNESSGMIRGSPGRDYSSESSAAAVHPLSTSNSSSPSFSSRPLPQQQQQQQQHRSQTPTMISTPTFQHQQLVKIKSEHGLTTPHPQQQHHYHQHQHQQMGTPDIVMTDEDGEEDEDEAGRDSEQPTPSPMIPNAETMDEDQDGDHGHGLHHHHHHPSQQEKTPLMVDTSSGAIHSHTSNPRGAHMSMASPNMTATPSTATLTPDSGATSSASRRPSLRTMTATLPRSALQEETIALFKQYRNLIPCAKCFSRNTIQRDGMSDGNLRFKCRPPVSMSLICNKSYSESKIRNMISGVVYGHSLPESGTPTSATSSENVLALALPPNMTKSGSGRRPSQKHADANMTSNFQQSHAFQDDYRSRHHQDRKGGEREQYQEHSHSGTYEETGDDRSGRPGSRRPSSAMSSHPRRPSLIGQESPTMDYEESTMMGPPSGHLQVPITPPREGEDPRMYRPHSAYGHRPLTPVGAPAPAASSSSSSSTSNSSNLAPRQGAPKLHHSHSHPNIGQQRHQQYLDQQSHIQQQQQQPQQSRQVARIEPAQPHHGHGSDFARSEMAERRFSHPAALQRSPSSKYLPVAPSNAALSPALSSSSQSSPRYESVHTPANSTGPGGRYEETHAQASYYQRRMSQPHPGSQRPYSQLPPPPPAGSSHRYDRRASEVDEYNYQHLRQYERLNASTMRGGHPLKSKISPKQYSPPHSSDSPSTQRDGPVPPPSSSAAYAGKPGYPPSSSPLLNSNVQGLRTPQSEPMRLSHSMTSIEAPGSATSGATSAGGRHAYQTPRQQASSSSVYYHQPSSRDDLEIRDSYAHDSSRGDLSPEDADGRPYARMRQGFRKPGMGQSIRRLGSSPNLHTAGSMTASSSLTSAKDLNSALPRNAIKLTCFPSAVTASKDSPLDSQATGSAAAGDDLDMKMSQSSKVVIEITQPRSTFDRSSSSSSLSGFDDVPRPLLLSASTGHPRRALRHAVSQPNLLVRNSSSVLERRRRSVSPSDSGRGVDGNSGEDGFGSSKKRRADSLSRDEDVLVTSTPSSSSVAEAAAAAVVAAAANAARQNSSSAGGVQIIGQDCSKKEVVGLGVVMDDDTAANTSTNGCNSPMINALDVAKASSYVSLEDQKELGIDYSLFTRVETAAWRILIPPNVTASFRSEDFGLTLKPKAVSEAAASASLASPTSTTGGCSEITPLVAPMAAISTNETEDEEKEVQVDSVNHARKEQEGEGIDVVMEANEEDSMTTAASMTAATIMTVAREIIDTAAVDSREEMMDHQLEDD